MSSIPAYHEVAILLAKLDRAKIIIFQSSESCSKRLSLLLEKNRDGLLSFDENYELDRLLALDDLIALTKAYARIHLVKRIDILLIILVKKYVMIFH